MPQRAIRRRYLPVRNFLPCRLTQRYAKNGRDASRQTFTFYFYFAHPAITTLCYSSGKPNRVECAGSWCIGELHP
jgi:hypothetical protein